VLPTGAYLSVIAIGLPLAIHHVIEHRMLLITTRWHPVGGAPDWQKGLSRNTNRENIDAGIKRSNNV